jgi:uncharacterized protein YjbI with pentapeptide repeats
MYNSKKFTTQYVSVSSNTVLNYPQQLTNDTILTVNIPQDIARIPNVSLSVVSCCIASNEKLGYVVLKTDNVPSNYVGNDNQGCILSNLYFTGTSVGASDFFHYSNKNDMDLSYSNLNQLRVYFEYISIPAPPDPPTAEKIGLSFTGASAITAEFSIVFKLCYENTEEINKQYREQINPHLV